MNNSTRKLVSIALACAAGALLATSLALPVWKMRMDAPQYQGNEALKVTVYPNKMTGDLDEIVHIQQYVGISIPRELPQLVWLPKLLIGTAALSLIAAFLPIVARRRTLIVSVAAVSIALAVAAGQAQYQMYKIGHERTKAPLARVQSFTTPLLGDLKFANFNISSRLGLGSFVIGAALLMQLAAARLSGRKENLNQPDRPVLSNPHPAFKRTVAAKAGTTTKKFPSEIALTTYEI